MDKFLSQTIADKIEMSYSDPALNGLSEGSSLKGYEGRYKQNMLLKVLIFRNLLLTKFSQFDCLT